MAKKKSPKKGRVHPLEETPITQEMLDNLASLPPEQFQREIVRHFHEIYIGLLETVNWTAEQRDMACKFFGETLKTVAKRTDERVKMLEDWAFTITLVVNDLRGLPPSIERNRAVAEMFNIDFDATVKTMQTGA